MPIKITQEEGRSYLRIHCSGKVVKADYLLLVPLFEKAVKEDGAQKILFDLVGFEGWDFGALWEEPKFDYKHLADIQRCAVIGDKKWEQVLANFFKPFTKAKIRYFERADAAEAQAWLLKT
jgi:hypothetical protein